MKRIVKWSSLIVAVLIVCSCETGIESEIVETNDEEVSSAIEVLDTENMADEDITLLNDALGTSNGSSSSRVLDLCAEITVDSTNHVVTIDFGEGCIGPYGRTRSGKVVSTYGGSFNDNEANRVITFEEYFVNSKEITGSIELGNYNLTEDSTFTSTQTLNNYTVTFPNGTSKSIDGTTVREIIEGFGDYNIFNNETWVTGGFTTTTTSGATHTYTILEPVKLSYACLLSGNMLRIAGVVEITRTNAIRVRTKIIDYGQDCDNEYTVSIDNELITVEE